jgi:hypothetical protein
VRIVIARLRIERVDPIYYRVTGARPITRESDGGTDATDIAVYTIWTSIFGFLVDHISIDIANFKHYPVDRAVWIAGICADHEIVGNRVLWHVSGQNWSEPAPYGR